MMDNTKVKEKVFERIYKLSKQILVYSEKMPSVKAFYDKYQGIIIYLLSLVMYNNLSEPIVTSLCSCISDLSVNIYIYIVK